MDIVKLAKKLSVSTATVSRALRPETAHLVRESLRRRIQEAAEQLGYIPSAAARGMRTQRALIVNVVIPADEYVLLGEYHGRLLSAIMKRTKELGIEFRISSLDNLREDFIESLWDASYGSGGIIYLGSTLSADNVKSLRRLTRPFAVIKSALPPDHTAGDIPASVIGVDNVHAGYLAARHLLELGHRRIAFLNAARALHFDAYERLLGIKKAFVEFAAPFESALYLESNPDFYSGADAWKKLSGTGKPTAVICVNDELARGVIRGAAEDGVRCPEDIAVIGFDDSRLAYFISPGLTSVRQPLDDVGAACVNTVHEAAQAGAGGKRDIDFQPELIVRESSGKPLPGASR
jgi:DNA-binding LacI/PurR family transcriptional regulator